MNQQVQQRMDSQLETGDSLGYEGGHQLTVCSREWRNGKENVSCYLGCRVQVFVPVVALSSPL